MPPDRRRALLALAACAVSASCLTDPFGVTDTGYVGTWRRGNDRAASTLAIVRDGDGYRVRWRKTSREPDGTEKLKVRCDWNGDCVETLNGELQATHRMRTRVDPATGHLIVETHEERTVPVPLVNDYLEEYVVEDGGRRLVAYTLERGGQRFEKGPGQPRPSFEKVSDAVAWPPRPGGA